MAPLHIWENDEADDEVDDEGDGVDEVDGLLQGDLLWPQQPQTRLRGTAKIQIWRHEDQLLLHDNTTSTIYFDSTFWKTYFRDHFSLTVLAVFSSWSNVELLSEPWPITFYTRNHDRNIQGLPLGRQEIPPKIINSPPCLRKWEKHFRCWNQHPSMLLPPPSQYLRNQTSWYPTKPTNPSIHPCNGQARTTTRSWRQTYALTPKRSLKLRPKKFHVNSVTHIQVGWDFRGSRIPPGVYVLEIVRSRYIL